MENIGIAYFTNPALENEPFGKMVEGIMTSVGLSGKVPVRKIDTYKEGRVLLIDKPLNWTSFQVVNKVRWLIKQQFNIKKIKVGHAGTLDPLATGLLILCTGKFTKKIETYQAQLKEYTGTITLGATTPSYDLESEIDQKFDISEISKEDILKNTQQFLGKIQQQPPIFSALKKNGKRLYEYAREGSKIQIPPRYVTIKEFQITKIELPYIEFRIVLYCLIV